MLKRPEGAEMVGRWDMRGEVEVVDEQGLGGDEHVRRGWRVLGRPRSSVTACV